MDEANLTLMNRTTWVIDELFLPQTKENESLFFATNCNQFKTRKPVKYSVICDLVRWSKQEYKP